LESTNNRGYPLCIIEAGELVEWTWPTFVCSSPPPSFRFVENKYRSVDDLWKLDTDFLPFMGFLLKDLLQQQWVGHQKAARQLHDVLTLFCTIRNWLIGNAPTSFLLQQTQLTISQKLHNAKKVTSRLLWAKLRQFLTAPPEGRAHPDCFELCLFLFLDGIYRVGKRLDRYDRKPVEYITWRE